MRVLPLVVLMACHTPVEAPIEVVPATTTSKRVPQVTVEIDAGSEPPANEFPITELASRYSTLGDQAVAQWRRQDFPIATAMASQALAKATDTTARLDLQILLAEIERDAGKFQSAAKRFAAAAQEDPLLADYLHFQAARAFAISNAGDQAQRHAEAVAATSPWALEREFLLAEVARSRGEHDKAVVHYKSFTADLGGRGSLSEETSKALTEAMARHGESLASLGRHAEAAAVNRTLLLTSPVSTWAEEIRKQSPKRVSSIEVSAGSRKLEAKLSGTERITRGMGYFRAMRNKRSEADFNAALRKSDLTKEQQCVALFHRAKSVYKERKYGRSAPLFVPAIAACKRSGNRTLEVKSAYHAGRAYSRSRQHELAVEHFAYIERYPKHSYADDARLRQAEEFGDLKKPEMVTKLLSSLPKDYPNGDMRGEAMWRLARRSYQNKNYEQAVGWLKKQVEVAPIETNWWAEGQAQYWLGRTLGRMGRAEDANKAYVDCIRLYPLTYYSMQAFNRLREHSPEAFQLALAEVKRGQSEYQHSFLPRAVYGKPEFARALRMAQLGLAKPAARELAALGFVVPDGRSAESDPDKLDKLLATMTLLDLAGDYEHSHWIGRWHNTGYRRDWPRGDNAVPWRLAYPLAFWDLLQEFAAKNTYPAHLQMAIVREESAFDPDRESYANAIGLTQMIFPTAIDHSVESGIKVTRENLQHPVKNVTIGSHFLESLQKTFEGRVGLMIPGYNAGPARVRGWIRTRHQYDLDEFIERIKGDQARRYTKRVLGSYFTYHYLDDGTVPVVRNEVPRRLSKLRAKR